MKSNSVFNFFVFFLKQYKRYMIIPIVFAVMLAVQESLGPYLIKTIVDGIPVAFSNQEWSPIMIAGVCYVLSVEAVNIMFRLRDFFKLRVFPEVKANIVVDMFDSLLEKSYSFHIDYFSGQLSNKIADMIKGIETIFNMVVDVLLWRILSLSIASVTLYFVQPYFALVLLVWSVIFVLGTIKLSHKTHMLAVRFSASRSHLFGKITDALANILSTILFQNQRSERSIIKNLLIEHKEKEQKLLRRTLLIGFYQGLMVTLFTACVTFGLIHLCRKGGITVGQFSLVMILSGTVIRNIYSVSSDLVQFSKEFGACSQAINTIFGTPNVSDDNNSRLCIHQGTIEYQDVCYSYGGHHHVLNHLSLKINAGEKIGIVGISGGGKTTLVNLLLRLFEPNSGQILIDNQNIALVTRASLCGQIAVVPQEPILFNRSIADNIRFGVPNATDDMIIDAAKRAYCHDFIVKLEQGYESVVGERGVKLSGGQKQRIALARAFLKDAPIVVFDEPTSALDSLTERYIHNSLSDMIEHKTAIVVAHRLSTLKHLDRILVFNQGQIIEQGTHAELLKNQQLYSQLWHEQNVTQAVHAA